MVKIWQTDFTSFSGVTDVLYDLVGTQHLTVTSGTINKQDPLLDFNYRKGVYFSANADIQRYVLYGGGTIDLTNARMTASYNYRSFVLWLYTYNMGNATYWETTANKINIWGSYNAGARVDYGICATSNGNGIEVLNNLVSILSYTSNLSNGWHCIVVTVDRIIPQMKLYIDTTLIGTSATTITANTPTVGEVIGDSGGSNEGSFYVGEATTYDHILNQTEIDNIYNTFLVDSIVGSDPYQTFSGYVYGLNNQVVSGASVVAYHRETESIVHITETNVSGYFSLDLPYSGTYVVIAEEAPYGGTRSIPVIATSGGVYFP